MDSMPALLQQLAPVPMLARDIAPTAEPSQPAPAGASAARKARFWDRIARQYAALEIECRNTPQSGYD